MPNYNTKEYQKRLTNGTFNKLKNVVSFSRKLVLYFRELNKEIKFNFQCLRENQDNPLVLDNIIGNIGFVQRDLSVFPLKVLKQYKKDSKIKKERGIIKQMRESKPIKRSVKLHNYLLDKYFKILTASNFGYYYRWLLENDSIDNQKTFLGKYLKKISIQDIKNDIEFKKTLMELM